MCEKKQRLSRFPMLRKLLPADIPSVKDILTWSAVSSLAGRIDEVRQAQIWDAVMPPTGRPRAMCWQFGRFLRLGL